MSVLFLKSVALDSIIHRVRRFTEAVRLLLHIDEGDASLTKQWFYVILNPERRRYGKMFSVF